jgi:hypothetical protein
VAGTGLTRTPAGLGLFDPDRRRSGDSPIAAFGIHGWTGTSRGAPAIGSLGEVGSGVEGVEAAGGDGAGRAVSDGSWETLAPFEQDGDRAVAVLLLLGLLLVLVLLVRHELPRR